MPQDEKTQADLLAASEKASSEAQDALRDAAMKCSCAAGALAKIGLSGLKPIARTYLDVGSTCLEARESILKQLGSWKGGR